MFRGVADTTDRDTDVQLSTIGLVSIVSMSVRILNRNRAIVTGLYTKGAGVDFSVVARDRQPA